MKIDTTTLLLLGAAALGGWCFFMGPCKGWLSNLGDQLAPNRSATVVAKTVVADHKPIAGPGSAITKGVGGLTSVKGQSGDAVANYTRGWY